MNTRTENTPDKIPSQLTDSEALKQSQDCLAVLLLVSEKSLLALSVQNDLNPFL